MFCFFVLSGSASYHITAAGRYVCNCCWLDCISTVLRKQAETFADLDTLGFVYLIYSNKNKTHHSNHNNLLTAERSSNPLECKTETQDKRTDWLHQRFLCLFTDLCLQFWCIWLKYLYILYIYDRLWKSLTNHCFYFWITFSTEISRYKLWLCPTQPKISYPDIPGPSVGLLSSNKLSWVKQNCCCFFLLLFIF